MESYARMAWDFQSELSTRRGDQEVKRQRPNIICIYVCVSVCIYMIRFVRERDEYCVLKKLGA